VVTHEIKYWNYFKIISKNNFISHVWCNHCATAAWVSNKLTNLLTYLFTYLRFHLPRWRQMRSWQV